MIVFDEKLYQCYLVSMTMKIIHTCWCGTTCKLDANISDQYFKCGACGELKKIEKPETQSKPEKQSLETAFEDDRSNLMGIYGNEFMIQQLLLSIAENYHIFDSHKNSVLFATRSRYLALRILWMFVFILGLLFTVFGCVFVFSRVNFISSDVEFYVSTAIVFIYFSILAQIGFKRHIYFYKDKNQLDLVAKIIQNNRVMIVHTDYSLYDKDDQLICRICKNNLTDFFRKRWVCIDKNQNTLLQAFEDSIILSLLRRVLGNLYGLLRMHFIITTLDQDDVLADLNRKFSIRDKYQLTFLSDIIPQEKLLIFFALSVLLDTGERR